MASGSSPGYELWVEDLSSGKMDKLLPSYFMSQYAVSRDGQQVAFTIEDQSGRSSLWIAPTSRRTSPVRISATSIEDTPIFLPSGDLIFRAVENGSNFLYRMRPDGGDRRKIASIIDLLAISPDGHWVVAGQAGSDAERSAETKAIAIDGSATITLCHGYCGATWDTGNKYVYLDFPQLAEKIFAMRLEPDSGLPKVPAGGIARTADFEGAKSANAKALELRAGSRELAIAASAYAYTVETTRRNLYRVPLP
jgi:hypothetical protein